MRISVWSSDVFSSDLLLLGLNPEGFQAERRILDGAPGNRRMDEAGIERQHVVGRNLVLAVHDARPQHAIGMRGTAHIVAHANGRDDDAELARQLAADAGEAAPQRGAGLFVTQPDPPIAELPAYSGKLGKA